MDNKENFRKFLVKWMADNWTGNRSAFAEFLGITRQRLSNILTGHRGASEKSRIEICNKIGVDYRSVIRVDLGEKKYSKADVKSYCGAPLQSINPRLRSMQLGLQEIFESGDVAKISAIETNIATLRTVLQMEKHARKRACLSLQEEDETLMKQPNLKESA
jgi:transcriptional regulator with XRE-family HTH domain